MMKSLQFSKRESRDNLTNLKKENQVVKLLTDNSQSVTRSVNPMKSFVFCVSEDGSCSYVRLSLVRSFIKSETSDILMGYW